MRTRNSHYPNNSPITIPRCRNRRRAPNIVEPELRTIVEVAPIADNRTMKELLQAPTEGCGEAIVIPEINAGHFEIKTNLLQLVQANPFHGFKRENPYTHINNFKRITSTLKFRDVPNDVIKLMMFPYSLEGAARVWYDKEPPKSILTWDDLVNKFVNQFFPPLKTTHLKNEISRFTQKFEETFGEAWERFKEMLRACPHHTFTELTQIDTFYNGLNENDQDTLNAEVGGNLLIEIVTNKVVTPATVKAVEESCVICGDVHAYYNCNATDSNQSSVCAATGSFFQNQALTSGILPSNTIPNPKGEIKAITTRSGVAYEGPSIPTNPSPKKVVERKTEETMDKEQNNFQGSTAYIQPPVIPIPILEPNVPKTLPKPNIPYPSILNDQKIREKATNQIEKFFQIFQDLHFDISFADALLLMPKFASTIKSLFTNKDKLFELAKIPLNENCSAMLLKKLPEKIGDPDKFLIPCDFPGMNVCHALADLGASINLIPFSIWKKLSLPELTPTQMTLELADRSITRPKEVVEDVFVKVGKFHFPTDFVVIDFDVDPRVPLILGRSFLRTGRVLIDVYGEEITLRVNDEAVTFNLNQTTRYSSTYDDMSVNRIDVIDVACEEYAQEVLGFSNNSTGDNPTLTSKPIISNSSLSLTPFEGSDFILEEIEVYLKDDSISPKIDHADFDLEGDLHLIEELLNNDPSSPLPLSHNPLSCSTTFSSPSLTPVETSDALLEEFADELALLEPFPLGIGDDDFDPEGDILLLRKFLNDDPSSPLPPKEFNFEKLKMIKSSIDDFPPLDILEKKSMTFSNPLFDSNDDFTSSDDESLSDEDIPEDNVKIYSNLLFEYDDVYISCDVNPLFDEVLENITSKDSYVPKLDEPNLLVTLFSDANKDECFDPGGDIDEIDDFLDIDVSTDVEDGYHDSEGDIIYLERLLINNTFSNIPSEVFLHNEPRSLKDEPNKDDLKSMVKVFDPEIYEKKISPTYVRLSFEDRLYFSLTYVIRIFLPYFTYPVDSSFLLSSGSEDTIFGLDISAFHFSSLELVAFESQMEVCSSTCFIPNIMIIWGESS
ncbi:reverse transcriptase domain-containing protein [Tanacetum coccineum]|uniref:Reverse transcriptase domain-containing protein n=1 Tax=Tanacetum coccineum TaxID=301880 RepID=A0ABQ5FBY7_9ASTR